MPAFCSCVLSNVSCHCDSSSLRSLLTIAGHAFGQLALLVERDGDLAPFYCSSVELHKPAFVSTMGCAASSPVEDEKVLHTAMMSWLTCVLVPVTCSTSLSLTDRCSPNPYRSKSDPDHPPAGAASGSLAGRRAAARVQSLHDGPQAARGRQLYSATGRPALADAGMRVAARSAAPATCCTG